MTTVEDTLATRVALERMVSSDGWRIYIELLQNYVESKRKMITVIDPELSALKYNDKDIALNTMYTIDDMSNLPGIYIENLSIDTDSEEDISLEVDKKMKEVVSSANKYIEENKL